MSIDLEQVVLDGGLRFVNFFEGRILTGRDLRDEQKAARQGRGALARAIGWGVVHGLEVTDATPAGVGAAPAVRVRAGLGISRDGQTLDLAGERTVRLAELDAASPERGELLFDLCADQPSTSGAPTAEGFHILTLAPATAYEEEAPKSGLGDSGKASGCGRRYVTLGLRFRLVRFDPALLAGGAIGSDIGTLATATGDPALSRLRNLVAHLGLGTAARTGFGLEPFATAADGDSAWGSSAWNDWDLEARLSTGADPLLMACELPLAVLRLRAGQIAYVDMWTIRRGRRRPSPAAGWPLLASPAREAADAAMLFQFQNQLTWLTNPGAVQASQHFRYLPPVGFLPRPEPAPFLPNARAPLPLEPGRVIPLVEQALAYPAVDLDATPAPGFTTYRVTGSWILFVSDLVPSAELKSQRCAELEGRIDMLERMLAAPGSVTGSVTLRPDSGSGSLSLSGVTIRATAVDGSVTEAVSGEDGSYALNLQPGTYTIVSSYRGLDITARGIETVEVARGVTLTSNFVIRLQDLSGPGRGG